MLLNKKSFFLFLFLIFANLSSAKYIGGDKWNKKLINKNNIYKLNEAEKDFFFKSAKVITSQNNKTSVGTSFYVKEIESGFLFLTNYHVIENKRTCLKSKIIILDKNFNKHTAKCYKILKQGTYKDQSDYTYFIVKKIDKLDFLKSYSETKFSESLPLVGDKLSFLGFGGSKYNKNFSIKISNDKDCIFLKAFSKITLGNTKDKEEVKDIISTGCDTESGDSGSALFNRYTGEVVGLLFGSHLSKTRSINLSSDYIKKNLDNSPITFVKFGSWAIQSSKLKFGN